MHANVKYLKNKVSRVSQRLFDVRSDQYSMNYKLQYHNLFSSCMDEIRLYSFQDTDQLKFFSMKQHQKHHTCWSCTFSHGIT